MLYPKFETDVAPIEKVFTITPICSFKSKLFA